MSFFFQQILEADHLPPVSLALEIFIPSARTHDAMGMRGIWRLASLALDIALLSPVRFAVYFVCLALRTVSGKGSVIFNIGSLVSYLGIFIALGDWFGKVLGIELPL